MKVPEQIDCPLCDAGIPKITQPRMYYIYDRLTGAPIKISESLYKKLEKLASRGENDGRR